MPETDQDFNELEHHCADTQIVDIVSVIACSGSEAGQRSLGRRVGPSANTLVEHDGALR